MRALLATLALLCAVPVSAQTIIAAPTAGSASSGPSPTYLSGNYYPSMQGTVSGGATFTTGNLRVSPVMIWKATPIDGIAVIVSTLANGGTAAIHVWNQVNAFGKPTGSSSVCTVSTTTTGIKTCTFGAPVAFSSPGIYWFGIELDSTAGGTAIFQTFATAINAPTYLIGSPTLSTLGGALGKVQLNWSRAYTGTSADITSATLSDYTSGGDALIYFHIP